MTPFYDASSPRQSRKLCCGGAAQTSMTPTLLVALRRTRTKIIDPADFPAKTAPMQSLDFGNPYHVATLVSTQATAAQETRGQELKW